MSAPQANGGGAPDEPDPAQFAKSMRLMRRIAKQVCQEAKIDAKQEAGDLAQHAWERLLSKGGLAGEFPDERAIARVMKRRANRIRERRVREQTNLDPPAASATEFRSRGSAAVRPLRQLSEIIEAPRPTGIPPLGELFIELARPIGKRDLMLQHVRAAATVLARRPSVLQRRQYPVFRQAFVEQLSISEIARLRGSKPRFVRRSIARVAERINEALMTEVRLELDSAGKRLLGRGRNGPGEGKKSKSSYRLQQAVCSQIPRVLQAVIHSETGRGSP